MPLGDLIRDRRRDKNLTQARLADELCASARDASGAPGRDAVKRWESGKVIPGPFWLTHLSRVLGLPLEQLQAEATLARVNRRSFLTWPR
ncbi:helix-turn-helix domain-containing protein [Streptomyces litchfieldiae]|uniref:Helix-turn-helix transcriptional regulator n=1 Tax=Streptomyces litchfieldiae TaxID=3075543 RepID=A0ABU2MKE9_9ACTN|nr:helix-turn-helix transcriptional regulator [Streptomyces sp. DSM 44938]MDT0342077.1 helix-turn-helix transcriptional regulator [Streptomyces sp. DSM 44938]